MRTSRKRTTNVAPSDLHYDHDTGGRYDREIRRMIPYHREVHECIVEQLERRFPEGEMVRVLDLGAGTGITAEVIRGVLPNARLVLVDFSARMIAQAKKRLGFKRVRYQKQDYSRIDLGGPYDLIVSVIGMHHQTTAGKKAMFKKIHAALTEGGVFLYADLMTHRDPRTAAINQARHFHHLVEQAGDERVLGEWAHHHLYRNDLAAVEDQIIWLRQSGFVVRKAISKINTVLLVCTK